MENNPLKKYREPSPGEQARLNPTLWVVLILIGVFALGGFVFNLGRLFNTSRSLEPTAPAPRSSSAEIEINSTVSLSAEAGSFTIWGDPVNRDEICARGEVFDLEYSDLSPDPEVLTDLVVSKQFQCADGSGSFYLIVDVDITENTTSGTWEITGGEGDYGGLSGAGTLQGTYLDGDRIVDAYTGSVSN